jgi:hypothetical protein
VIEEKTGPPLTILFDYDLVDILIFSSETSVLNDLLHGLWLYIKSCPFSTYFFFWFQKCMVVTRANNTESSEIRGDIYDESL